jgi:hypothetical protein
MGPSSLLWILIELYSKVVLVNSVTGVLTGLIGSLSLLISSQNESRIKLRVWHLTPNLGALTLRSFIKFVVEGVLVGTCGVDEPSTVKAINRMRVESVIRYDRKEAWFDDSRAKSINGTKRINEQKWILSVRNTRQVGVLPRFHNNLTSLRPEKK